MLPAIVKSCPVCLSVVVFCILVLPAAEGVLADEVVTVPAVEVEASADRSSLTVARDSISSGAALEAPGGPADQLDRAPAAHVRQAGGPGQAATLSIRGVDPQGTSTLLEGVPLNSPFLGGSDLSTLSLLPLDSLVVERGGASARQGSDAVGGVLRAILPDPLDGPFLRASLLYGSFGTCRLKAAAGGVTGPVGGMVSAGILTSAGDFSFRDVNGVARQRENNASLAVEGLVRAGYEPKSGHRLGILVEGLLQDRQIPGLEQYPSTTAKQQNDRFVARLSYDGPGLFGRSGTSSIRVWTRRLGFAFADTAPPLGPRVDTRLVSWSAGGEAEAEVVALDLLAVSAGVNATFDHGEVRRLTQASYAPIRTAAAGRVGVRAGRKGGRWGIDTDLRVEWDRGFGFIAVPRAGAFVRPWGPFRFTANVGRAFRLPTLEELYFDAGFVTGNPNLRPEDALTWDVGVEATGVGWGVRAAWFENRARNLVVFLPRSAYLVRAENSGGAIMRGVESSADGHWRWFFAKVAYTWMTTRMNDTGKALPGRPEHRVAGEVAAEIGPIRIAVMPSWQSGFFLDGHGALSEDGRFRLDARVELRPARGVTLALEGMNLTNDRDAVDYLQSPLPGWSMFGSIRLDL